MCASTENISCHKIRVPGNDCILFSCLLTINGELAASRLPTVLLHINASEPASMASYPPKQIILPLQKIRLPSVAVEATN